MPQLPLTINGRVYRLGCGEGDEARLRELASIVAQKVDGLVAEFGQAGEARLLFMAALLVADELIDTRAALDATIAEQADALKRVAESATPAPIAAPEPTAEQAPAEKAKKPPRIELPGKAASA